MADDDSTQGATTTAGSDATSSQGSAATDTTSTTSTATGIPAEVERALRKANKEAETLRLKLKDFEDRDKTEAQRLTDGLAEARRDADLAKSELLRMRVALAKGIDAEMAEFLTGQDEETLMAQAEKLAARIAKRGGISASDVDAGARTTSSSDPKQWSEADLKGKSPEQIREASDKGLLDDLMNIRA